MEMDLRQRIEQAIGKLESKYERLQEDLKGQNSMTLVRFISEDLKKTGMKLAELRQQHTSLLEN